MTSAIPPSYPNSGDSKRTVPINIPSMTSGETSPRPQSALARGVKITQISTRETNPKPITPEESEYLLEDYLSPRKLKLLTGMDDLREVHYLEMKVDTRDTSLGNFGMHLPNLTQLKLSNSIITQTRDLGTCLDGVRVLWMAQCGLEDIDGLSSMFNLRELYLAYNEISDISPCSMLEHLQILDLEGNAISDITQVEFLALCMKLENLTLEGNPICTTPNVDQTSQGYNYRLAVRRAIPHLALLDDEPLVEELGDPVEEQSRAGSSSAFVFEDDWNLINEFYSDGTIMDRDEVLEDELLPAPRPGTSSLRPATGYRPGSALKPYTATLGGNALPSRHGSRHGSRPGTGPRGSSRGSGSPSSRPGTSGGLMADDLEQQDDSSALTQGSVLCGNLTKALLRSRKPNSKPTQNKDALKVLAKLKFKAEHTYDDATNSEKELIPKELMDELKQWKDDYQKQREKIQATKAPQVLTISYDDHDDAISLSGDDESIETGSEHPSDEEFDLSLPKDLLNNSDTSPLPDSGISSDQGYAVYGAKPKKQVGVSPPAPNRRRLRLRNSDEFTSSMVPHTPPSPPVPPINGQTPSPGGSKSLLRSPSPLMQRAELEHRPSSGPDSVGPRKFKLNPVIDKSRTKVIDMHNPIVRASVTSPEKMEVGRAITAKAALGQPPLRSSSIRSKGQLANVALLPSRPPSFARSDSMGGGSKS